MDLAAGVRGDRSGAIFARPPTWGPDPARVQDPEEVRAALRQEEEAAAQAGGPSREMRHLFGGGLGEQVGALGLGPAAGASACAGCY